MELQHELLQQKSASPKLNLEIECTNSTRDIFTRFKYGISQGDFYESIIDMVNN